MNLEEAQATYESLIFEYSDLSDDDQIHAMETFLMNKRSLYERHISLGEFKNNFKKCFLTHTSSYDTLNKETHERLKNGTIILVSDPASGKSIIIDGNHRINSYLEESDEIITVVEISAPVPDSICTYNL